MSRARAIRVSTLVALIVCGSPESLGRSGGLLQAATLTRRTVQKLSLSPANVAGGSSVIGTVTISLAAPKGGSSILLSSSNSAVAALTSSTIVIPAGQTSGTFTLHTTAVNSPVPVTISATLHNTVSATLTVTPPQVSSLSLAPATVTGGQGSRGAVVLSSEAAAGGASVTLTSSNADAAVPATVTVPGGALSVSFAITSAAVPQQISVTITASFSGSQSMATLTLEPPVVTALAFNPSSVIGGQMSTGTVTLNANAPPGGFPVGLMSNSAAVPVPAIVTVSAGTQTQSFSVTTTVVSSSQMAAVVATTGTATAMASLTVSPQTALQASLSSLSFSPATVTGGTSSTGTVTLSSPAPAGGTSVSLSSSDPSVTVPASLLVPAGQATQTFSATTTGVAAAKNVTVNATLGTASVNGALTVNPAVITSVSFSPSSLTGGTNSTGTLTLSGPAPLAGLTVTLTISMSSVATVPASFSFPAAATAGTFSATSSPVSANTTVSITATLPSGNAGTGSLTVIPPVVTQLAFSPATVGYGQMTTGTVVLNENAPASGFSVGLSSGDPAAVPVPAALLVPAGTKSQTFAVTAGAVTSQTPVTVTASTGSTSAMGMLTVNPALSANPPSVVFGSGTFVGVASTQTISLKNTAGVSVSITSIAASGPFTQTNTCPASLAAGASCIITLTPTQGGNLTGNVTILSNAGNPALTVNLSGTAMHWVGLSWGASSTPGVGYNIYRQLRSAGVCGVPSAATYSLLNSSPISATNFNDTDPSLVAGDTYCYSVTAVDSGGQSAFTNPATSATIPSP